MGDKRKCLLDMTCLRVLWFLHANISSVRQNTNIGAHHDHIFSNAEFALPWFLNKPCIPVSFQDGAKFVTGNWLKIPASATWLTPFCLKYYFSVFRGDDCPAIYFRDQLRNNFMDLVTLVQPSIFFPSWFSSVNIETTISAFRVNPSKYFLQYLNGSTKQPQKCQKWNGSLR